MCGAQPDREGFEQLRRLGIKTVVSLRATRSDVPDLAGLGFRYYGMSVKHFHPEDEDVLAFLKIVQTPENQPVFLHCRSGVDRTGMMVAAYRMVIENWSHQRALEEMKSAGFHSQFPLIERYVQQLDVRAMRKKLRNMQPPEIEWIR